MKSHTLFYHLLDIISLILYKKNYLIEINETGQEYNNFIE